MFELLATAVRTGHDRDDTQAHLLSSSGELFTTNSKHTHPVEMPAMRNVSLGQLQVGAAHVADDAPCSLDPDMNRPMSLELKHIAA